MLNNLDKLRGATRERPKYEVIKDIIKDVHRAEDKYFDQYIQSVQHVYLPVEMAEAIFANRINDKVSPRAWLNDFMKAVECNATEQLLAS